MKSAIAKNFAHPMDVENFLKMFYGDVYEKYLEKILEDF